MAYKKSQLLEIYSQIREELDIRKDARELDDPQAVMGNSLYFTDEDLQILADLMQKEVETWKNI